MHAGSSNDTLVETVSLSNDITNTSSSAARQKRWVQWLGDRDELHASTAYDVWSFGVLLYTLCVPGAVSMFLSSASDNLLSAEDLHTLGFEWELRKLETVAKIEWMAARDLVLWCL